MEAVIPQDFAEASYTMRSLVVLLSVRTTPWIVHGECTLSGVGLEASTASIIPLCKCSLIV